MNPVDLSHPAVFDPVFYAGMYPDLRAAGLTTPDQLKAHWLNFGCREGRQGSAEFHAMAYAANNPGLLQELAVNITQQLTAHYIVRGRAAGLDGSP